MNVVEVEGLKVRYGRRIALDGVSLSLPRGAAGLLGPNGAGKSTLMKTLLGFLRADAGRIRVLGQDMPAQALAVRRASAVGGYGKKPARRYRCRHEVSSIKVDAADCSVKVGHTQRGVGASSQ